MTGRRGFVCGGSWVLDHIKLVDRWPVEETLAQIIGTERQGGGSAHNFGVDIRKLDPTMPVEAIGLLGRDADGDFLTDRAHEAGVDTRQLRRTDAAATSYTDVVSDIGTGRRTFFHHVGANDLLTPDDFDMSQTSGHILHLGLLGLHRHLDEPWRDDPNGWVTILKAARSAGLETNVELVSIDPGRIRDVCRPCLPHLDTLVVNDHEIGALADLPTVRDGETDVELVREAARIVLDAGAMRVVAVHYPRGAICVSRNGQIFERPSVPTEPHEIGSTVGAGDAFAAGMLLALHEAWPIPNALELAHAAAAASLRSPTTVGSVEDVDTCLELAGYTRPSRSIPDVTE